MKTKILLVCAAILASLPGCSDSPKGPDTLPPGPPAFVDASKIAFTRPANAPDEVTEFISAAARPYNSLFTMFDAVHNSRTEGRHPDWTWRADFNPHQLIIRATTIDDASATWSITLDGSGLDNWLSASGTTERDGESAAWTFFRFASQETDAFGHWSRNEQGALFLSTELRTQPQGDRSPRLIQVSASSDSGSTLAVYDRTTPNEVLRFTATWDADGGTWTRFDADGNQEADGSWTN